MSLHRLLDLCWDSQQRVFNTLEVVHAIVRHSRFQELRALRAQAVSKLASTSAQYLWPQSGESANFGATLTLAQLLSCLEPCLKNDARSLHYVQDVPPLVEGAHELVTEVEKALRGPSFQGHDREMAKKVQRKAKKMAQHVAYHHGHA